VTYTEMIEQFHEACNGSCNTYYDAHPSDERQLTVLMGEDLESAYRLLPNVAETDAVLVLIEDLQHVELTDKQRPIMVAGFGEELYAADKASLFATLLRVTSIEVLTGSNLYAKRKGEIKEIRTALTKAVDNLAVYRSCALIATRNAIHNLPNVIRDRDLEPGRVSPSKRAVICGAGPSLSQQFDLLKAASENCLIIAVGHSLKSLLDAGITPDAVVEIDLQCHMHWPPELTADCLLVASVSTSPTVARRFPNAVWCPSPIQSVTTMLNQLRLPLQNYRMAKTVTVTAIDFAVTLGCSEIALVGQELSVGENGAMHVNEQADGSQDELVELPGNDVPVVMTRPDMAAIHKAVSEYAVELKKDWKGTLHNCTLGGARIHGTERTEFADFIENAPHVDCIELVKRKRETMPTPDLAERAEELSVVITTTGNLCGVLRELITELERAKPRTQVLDDLQEQMRQLDSRLNQNDCVKTISGWIAAAREYGLEFADRMLVPRPADTDPIGQLEAFEQQLYMEQLHFKDMLQDFDVILPLIESGPKLNDDAERRCTPLHFLAYQEAALRCIRRSQGELAEKLEQHNYALSERFVLYPYWQQGLPFVRLKTEQGMVRLSALVFNGYPGP
jgi:hypothetical protein